MTANPKVEWDYTAHADSYSARPNYADEAIDELVELVGARKDEDYLVADVGAGTANLTVMLLARGLRCVAVEPNEAMRNHGKARTEEKGVKWYVGTGEATTLPDSHVDWVTFGSSFNTTDREKSLAETKRILKPRGWFTCMWNHRDLEDPLQKRIEGLIREMCPDYVAGTRREDQTELLEESGLFEKVHFIEATQPHARTVDEYVEAWRSTRNLSRVCKDDAEFEKVLAAIREEVSKADISMNYTTRIWAGRLTE